MVRAQSLIKPSRLGFIQFGSFPVLERCDYTSSQQTVKSLVVGRNLASKRSSNDSGSRGSTGRGQDPVIPIQAIQPNSAQSSAQVSNNGSSPSFVTAHSNISSNTTGERLSDESGTLVSKTVKSLTTDVSGTRSPEMSGASGDPSPGTSGNPTSTTVTEKSPKSAPESVRVRFHTEYDHSNVALSSVPSTRARLAGKIKRKRAPKHAIFQPFRYDSSGNPISSSSGNNRAETEENVRQYVSSDDDDDDDIEDEMTIQTLRAQLKAKAKNRRNRIKRQMLEEDLKRFGTFSEMALTKLVKNIFNQIRPTGELKLEKQALKELYEVSELYITLLCETANLLVRHAKRVTLMLPDIRTLLQVVKFLAGDTMWNRLQNWHVPRHVQRVEAVRMGPEACHAEARHFSRHF